MQLIRSPGWRTWYANYEASLGMYPAADAFDQAGGEKDCEHAQRNILVSASGILLLAAVSHLTSYQRQAEKLECHHSLRMPHCALPNAEREVGACCGYAKGVRTVRLPRQGRLS